MPQQSQLKYKLTNSIHEHGEKPVYCVAFNNIDPAHRNLFASSGGSRVTVYECLEDGGITPVQGYEDTTESEEYYVVKWSKDKRDGRPVLIAAGRLGMARVFDCHKQSLMWTAKGHGEDINDIAVQPANPELFLTASRDWSIRLWNWRTKVCVVVIYGEGSHTNEVLSVDFHPLDEMRFVSAGMDDAIKIWSLEDNKKDIARSFEYKEGSTSSFKAGHLAGPVFSSQKVHWNYVDCARWYGDLILSKSVDHRILMWSPMMNKEGRGHMLSPQSYGHKGHVNLVQEFHLENAALWFVRFSLDPAGLLLACGNMQSQVFVFDLMAPSETAGRAKTKLRVAKEDITVRQAALSGDGKIILACCDDSRIHRFDVQSPADSRDLDSMPNAAALLRID